MNPSHPAVAIADTMHAMIFIVLCIGTLMIGLNIIIALAARSPNLFKTAAVTAVALSFNTFILGTLDIPFEGSETLQAVMILEAILGGVGFLLFQAQGGSEPARSQASPERPVGERLRDVFEATQDPGAERLQAPDTGSSPSGDGEQRQALVLDFDEQDLAAVRSSVRPARLALGD